MKIHLLTCLTPSLVLAGLLSVGCAIPSEPEPGPSSEAVGATAAPVKVESSENASGFHNCYLSLSINFDGACTMGWRVPSREDNYTCSDGHYSVTTTFSPVPCSNNPPCTP